MQRDENPQTQPLSTKPIAFSALVSLWRTATGRQSCLLTMQILLLITGIRRAKRKESFSLKEEWRDADGEGDLPCWLLRLLPGWEVGQQKTLGCAPMTPGPGETWANHTEQGNTTGTVPGQAV